MKTFKTVDSYIKSYPKDIQERLKKMRATIKKVAPKAVESISYGMPGYKLSGRPLVYFGASKNHIGFYATPTGNVAFKKELSKYKVGRGSIQFPFDIPLPLGLINRIVTFRVKETTLKKKAKIY